MGACLLEKTASNDDEEGGKLMKLLFNSFQSLDNMNR
jgi:hypothetical protein